MNKEQAKKHIEENLNDGDSLIGFFQAVTPPNFWLFLLIGPFFFISMRIYFLAVTEKGIFFHKLSPLGKFKEHDFFEFSEIESVKIGKGILQRPIKFVFINNRKIEVKAQLKGVGKVAKLLPSLQQYIESNISSTQ